MADKRNNLNGATGSQEGSPESVDPEVQYGPDDRTVSPGRKRARGRSREQVFYREVAVDNLGLAASRFFTTFFGWRCPACAGAGVSKGALTVIDSCPNCGSRFRRLEGNELISIPLSFFFASMVTFFVGLILVLNYGFFPGITWVLLAIGLVVTLAGIKPMRVMTLWLLWLIGFVYPDDVDKGKSLRPVTAGERTGAGPAASG